MADVNAVWLKLINNLLSGGKKIPSRDGPTLELLGYQTVIPMNDPIVTIKKRKLGYKFMAAEAAWILSGDNRKSSIEPYSKQIGNFSDDGLTFNGAYGPKFVDQLGYVTRCLNSSPESRQAVTTLWRERPGPTKDVPCTVALQWIWRDHALHCVATMRSSDAWLGWVYDVHAFSMMSLLVLLSLRSFNPTFWEDTKLGDLILTAGSQHLYHRNIASAEDCVDDPAIAPRPWIPFLPIDFPTPDVLLESLWSYANVGTNKEV